MPQSKHGDTHRTITQWVVTEPGVHPDSGDFWPLCAQTLAEAKLEYASDASMHALAPTNQVQFWQRTSTIVEHTWSLVEGDRIEP